MDGLLLTLKTFMLKFFFHQDSFLPKKSEIYFPSHSEWHSWVSLYLLKVFGARRCAREGKILEEVSLAFGCSQAQRSEDRDKASGWF